MRFTIKEKKEFAKKANAFLANSKRGTFDIHVIFKALPEYEPAQFCKFFNAWIRGQLRCGRAVCLSNLTASTKRYKKLCNKY